MSSIMKVNWTLILVFYFLLNPLTGVAKEKKVKRPFDLYDHELHNSFFEAANFPCETCHTNENAFTRETVNRLGCHECHKNQNPPAPADQTCSRCHPGGKFPKPQSHKAGWMSKHEAYAKQNPQECSQCHTDAMFCMDCHKRRDTVQQRMHKRNFRFFHSIEARANPKKCDACHTVNYCQQCHAGRGNSKR